MEVCSEKTQARQCPATEHLRSLVEPLERNQRSQYTACEKNERLHIVFGSAVIVLTAAVAAVTALDIPGWEPFITLGSLIAAILAGLQTSIGFEARALRHKTAAVDYGILLREVKSRLSGTYDEAANAEVLQRLLHTYASISECAPLTHYKHRLEQEKTKRPAGS